LPALLVSAGAGQRYQALSVLARALATPSIAADLRDRLGEQLRDVITMGVEGAALTGIRGTGQRRGPHRLAAGFPVGWWVRCSREMGQPMRQSGLTVTFGGS
jgi:hypothetical protein